jgi:hypothetical protein
MVVLVVATWHRLGSLLRLAGEPRAGPRRSYSCNIRVEKPPGQGGLLRKDAMQYYLTGAPLSTKKNEWTQDVASLRRSSEQSAIVTRATSLHESSPTGLDIRAARLTAGTSISHLRRTKSAHYLVLVWVVLSDGSRHRAAWLLDSREGTLYSVWQRVPWSTLVFASSVSTASSRPPRRTA